MKYAKTMSLCVSMFVVSLLVAACMLPAPKRKPVAFEAPSSTPERVDRYEYKDWTIARATLHNHTIYSDGCRTPEDLLEQAKAQGMAILAYNDHREGKICYGKYFCGDRGGVESKGYDVYYEHLRSIQEDALSRDMIVLKGIEVSPPHVRNHGKFPYLTLVGSNNHFTVYNVEDTDIFKNMPVRDEVPFKPETDYSDTPYREFVKYMDERGAIVHCVHPEWAPDGWEGPVHNMNIPPLHNVRIPGLVAFASLPESYDIVPQPGNMWDGVLAEYIAGMRDRPLWTAADADYHCDSSLARANTLFYMREFTEEEVYRCMREGRMVAIQGAAFQDSYVSQWSVSDGWGDDGKVMSGEEVAISGAPHIRFSLDHPVSGCRAMLIRNGVIIKTVEGTKLSHVDDWSGRAYYRVQVVGPVDEEAPRNAPLNRASLVFTNPIFVNL